MNKFDQLSQESSYAHNTTCWNCGAPQMLTIPKGTSISEFMRYKTCNSCGCPLVRPEISLDHNPKEWMQAAEVGSEEKQGTNTKSKRKLVKGAEL